MYAEMKFIYASKPGSAHSSNSSFIMYVFVGILLKSGGESTSYKMEPS
jgi:hypothetical protein